MRFKTRGQKLLGAIPPLLVLFVLTTLLDPVLAAPQQSISNGLARRADDHPGLGVELEMGNILLKNDAKLSEEDLEKLKGAEIIPIGFAGDPKTNWKLTAEISLSSNFLFPEAIVDGVKNKVGEKKSKGIGEEIFNFLYVYLSAILRPFTILPC